ncbi:N-acyl-D-amino-acid deacylase family protein [Novosphingobium malaysiense]|uniref:Amidohydrolase n=1 Tax=Novosphingobium malaysiense TaxID=1348853 RepID=A0A0B1ZH09_9SPHN|nr:amidohydrolase family protein [Novosphingobium malaysiense]KHK89792.1 amidohydrolase [Novosphingobium malaysiense]
MAQYDCVIRGGTVVDGTGGPSYRADVAIRDGAIADVGTVHEGGAKEIDAAGAVVTPGFVDIHTHYDGQITWENRLAPSSNHGVTTVVMGNCGVGFAPVRPDDHELVIKLMEGVEDIPDVVMASGVPWNWESFPDYLDALDQRRADVDFAAQLPHSPLRVFVMGERGAAMEPPTQSDLETMRALTCEAIKAGALGVSTSRNLSHRFRDGRPAPSVKTEADELKALAAGLRDARSGVFQLIPNLETSAKGETELMRAIAETAGRPLSFSLISDFRMPENWEVYREFLKEADAAGLPIKGQFYPRAMGVLFGLDLSYHPFSLNPSYRSIADLPLPEKVAAMRDPDLRARLLAEEPDDPSPFFKMIVQVTHAMWALGDPPDYCQRPEDSIAARARRDGVPEKELIYDELLKDEGRAILVSLGDPDPAEYVARVSPLFEERGAIVGLGDGGAHYGMICDAAYPTFVLTQLVAPGKVSIESAVRAMTRDTAAAVGLNDRGEIAVGRKADLNVIDLDRLRLGRPEVSHDLPGGGKRLRQHSEGYRATIVSGFETYTNGTATGELPGRLVRGARS